MKPPRYRRGALGGPTVFALCCARAVSSGFGTYDESWFLQVLERVRSGEVLYRDVFFGSAPLSVQALVPVVRAAGSEILVLRAASAAITAATAVACCGAARRAGLRPGRESSALLSLAVLVYGTPADPRPPYSPLATLGQVTCLAAVLGDRRRELRLRDAACAGAAAGASFAAKHNVGLATLAAMSLSFRVRRRRYAVVAYGSFAAVVGASLAPVLAHGAARRFIEYAFTNKRRYLRLGRLAYLEGLRPLQRPRGLPVRDVFAATKFLLPPAAGVGLLARLITARSPRERAVARTLSAFAAAAVLAAFPRADEEHLTWTLPPLLVALACSLDRLRVTARSGRVARSALWVWLGFGLTSSFEKPLELWRSGRGTICDLPHFQGVLEDRELVEQAREWAQALRAAAGQSPGATFILSPNAGQYYLLSGIRNPTPYDYPYATAFGHDGERDTALAVRRGEITTVLVDPADERLAAWELIRAVRATLPRIGEIGGDLHSRGQLPGA